MADNSSASKLQKIGKYIIEDGIATDTETGLTWLRFSYGQKWKNGDVIESAILITWDGAIKKANNFNSQGGYAGYTDWRVPTIDELKGLIDMTQGKRGNYINATIFPENQWAYWTSTLGDNYPNCEDAWEVHFSDGYCGLNQVRRIQNYVRLVRKTEKIISIPTTTDLMTIVPSISKFNSFFTHPSNSDEAIEAEKSHKEVNLKLENLFRTTDILAVKRGGADAEMKIIRDRIQTETKERVAYLKTKKIQWEIERQAKLEVEQQAKLETESKAEQEYQEKLKIERKIEAERQAKLKAQRKMEAECKAESERQTKLEIDRLKIESQQQITLEIERLKIESERQIKLEIERFKAEMEVKTKLQANESIEIEPILEAVKVKIETKRTTVAVPLLKDEATQDFEDMF